MQNNPENNVGEPQFTLNDTKILSCSCGSSLFLPVAEIREVSALISRTGKNEYIHMQKWACLMCKKVWEKPSNLVIS